MNQRVAIKTLECLCRKYQDECGESISSLSLYKFDYLFFTEGKISRIISKEMRDNSDYEIIGKIIDDLEMLGYVSKDFSRFTLTASGYEVGTRGLTKKIMHLTNKNPGLSIIISFITLIMSFVSIYLIHKE